MKPTFPNLIAATAAATQLSQALARLVLEAFFEQLAEAVWAQGRVAVPGLGLFQVRRRRAHRIVNPQTNRPVLIDAHRSVYARVAKSWRRRG